MTSAPLWQHGIVVVIAAAAIFYLVRRYRAKRGGACADCAARARSAKRPPAGRRTSP